MEVLLMPLSLLSFFIICSYGALFLSVMDMSLTKNYFVSASPHDRYVQGGERMDVSNNRLSTIEDAAALLRLAGVEYDVGSVLDFADKFVFDMSNLQYSSYPSEYKRTLNDGIQLIEKLVNLEEELIRNGLDASSVNEARLKTMAVVNDLRLVNESFDFTSELFKFNTLRNVGNLTRFRMRGGRPTFRKIHNALPLSETGSGVDFMRRVIGPFESFFPVDTYGRVVDTGFGIIKSLNNTVKSLNNTLRTFDVVNSLNPSGVLQNDSRFVKRLNNSMKRLNDIVKNFNATGALEPELGVVESLTDTVEIMNDVVKNLSESSGFRKSLHNAVESLKDVVKRLNESGASETDRGLVERVINTVERLNVVRRMNVSRGLDIHLEILESLNNTVESLNDAVKSLNVSGRLGTDLVIVRRLYNAMNRLNDNVEGGALEADLGIKEILRDTVKRMNDVVESLITAGGLDIDFGVVESLNKAVENLNATGVFRNDLGMGILNNNMNLLSDIVRSLNESSFLETNFDRMRTMNNSLKNLNDAVRNLNVSDLHNFVERMNEMVTGLNATGALRTDWGIAKVLSSTLQNLNDFAEVLRASSGLDRFESVQNDLGMLKTWMYPL